MLNLWRALAWKSVKRWVQRQFPGVPSIGTAALAEWLASDRPPPVLVDVRRDEEFTVSHLPGAQHLQTVEAVRQAGLPPDRPLVVYCSVGYRSARLAEKLQAAGYEHVLNLEGSIFEWYNQGYPIVVDQEPVQRVHPYNQVWGLLLKSPK